MTMQLKTRKVDIVNVVDINGKITLGEGNVILRDTIRNLLARGEKKILLNLGDVTYIDSSGIGELVSSFTTTTNQGGSLNFST